MYRNSLNNLTKLFPGSKVFLVLSIDGYTHRKKSSKTFQKRPARLSLGFGDLEPHRRLKNCADTLEIAESGKGSGYK